MRLLRVLILKRLSNQRSYDVFFQHAADIITKGVSPSENLNGGGESPVFPKVSKPDFKTAEVNSVHSMDEYINPPMDRRTSSNQKIASFSAIATFQNKTTSTTQPKSLHPISFIKQEQRTRNLLSKTTSPLRNRSPPKVKTPKDASIKPKTPKRSPLLFEGFTKMIQNSPNVNLTLPNHSYRSSKDQGDLKLVHYDSQEAPGVAGSEIMGNDPLKIARDESIDMKKELDEASPGSEIMNGDYKQMKDMFGYEVFFDNTYKDNQVKSLEPKPNNKEESELDKIANTKPKAGFLSEEPEPPRRSSSKPVPKNLLFSQEPQTPVQTEKGPDQTFQKPQTNQKDQSLEDESEEDNLGILDFLQRYDSNEKAHQVPQQLQKEQKSSRTQNQKLSSPKHIETSSQASNRNKSSSKNRVVHDEAAQEKIEIYFEKNYNMKTTTPDFVSNFKQTPTKIPERPKSRPTLDRLKFDRIQNFLNKANY